MKIKAINKLSSVSLLIMLCFSCLAGCASRQGGYSANTLEDSLLIRGLDSGFLITDIKHEEESIYINTHNTSSDNINMAVAVIQTSCDEVHKEVQYVVGEIPTNKSYINKIPLKCKVKEKIFITYYFTINGINYKESVK